MGTTCIRDCLGDVLLAGIKAWGLDTTEAQLREGLALFGDDDELVRAGEAVGVPPNVLRMLPKQLGECPSYLESRGARQTLVRAAEERQVPKLVNTVMDALGKVEDTLRHEAHSDRPSTILSTLAFLAMSRFCPQVRQPGDATCSVEGSESPMRCYVDAVVHDDRDLATKIEAQALATGVGQIVSRLLGRHARRTFTLAVAGDHSALAGVLADILAQAVREVGNGDTRTNPRDKKDDQEEA